MKKMMFIKICTYNLKKIVLIKFGLTDYENIQFLKQIIFMLNKFIFFLSIHFFLFLEKTFLMKKKEFSLFLKQMLTLGFL